jgi:hypothetical protein
LVENNFKENTETLEAGFFALNHLPELSTERNTLDQVIMCVESKKHKIFETVFD